MGGGNQVFRLHFNLLAASLVLADRLRTYVRHYICPPTRDRAPIARFTAKLDTCKVRPHGQHPG